MIKDNTFSLEDLDDTFWNKVIFIEIQHSSGLGGPVNCTPCQGHF